MRCEEFNHLSLEQLTSILSRNDLVVSSEVQLFGHILRWLGQDERKDKLAENMAVVSNCNDIADL